MGTKSDLEIISLLARELRAEDMGALKPEKVFDEIRGSVHGYNIPVGVVETGGAAPTMPLNGHVLFQAHPELIRSARNTLYTSGTLGRFSQMLNSVIESPGALFTAPSIEPIIKQGSVQIETLSHD